MPKKSRQTFGQGCMLAFLFDRCMLSFQQIYKGGSSIFKVNLVTLQYHIQYFQTDCNTVVKTHSLHNIKHYLNFQIRRLAMITL